MTGFLLDTHSWIWVQQRNTGMLSDSFFDEVEQWQRARMAYISAISILEVARLEVAGRIRLRSSVEQFLEDAVSRNGFQLLPLSPRVLIESTRLPGTIHRDPSDRLLAATAREHGLTLVTRDDALLDYSAQGHVNARKL